MWFLSPYKHIRTSTTNAVSISLHYTAAYYYTFAVNKLKQRGKFVYTTIVAGSAPRAICSEFHVVRLQYAGKAYRITKHKRILHVNMHYPTFKYVIWCNLKLKHTKKKKKLFIIRYNTFSHVRSNLFRHLLRLRVPNTYTRRGILNNASIYYNRKQRTPSRR